MKAAFQAVAALALVSSAYVSHAGAQAQIEPLPASGGWDYQLYGRYQSDPRVSIVSSNAGIRADPTLAVAQDVPIDPSLYNICYLNAFQTQPEDNQFWAGPNYAHLILMNGTEPVEDERWPGEYLFDISTPEKRAELIGLQMRWLTWCRDAGFKAVEPDNIDSYERSYELLTLDNAFEFMKEWAAAAHALGLAVAQKNSAEWAIAEEGVQPLAATVGFDFALVEECQLTGECAPLITYYGPQRVLEVEYWYDVQDTSSGVTVEAFNKDHFVAACTDHGDSARIVLRNRDVRPAGQTGFVFELCGDQSEATAGGTTQQLPEEGDSGPITATGTGTSGEEGGAAGASGSEQEEQGGGPAAGGGDGEDDEP
jgi:hypothetical protein